MLKAKSYIKCYDESTKEVFQVEVGPRTTMKFLTKIAEGYRIDLSKNPFDNIPIKQAPKNQMLQVY